MAEAPKDAKGAAPAAEEKQGRPPKKKKSQPTNCAQSNKRIRRKDWYYRNGKYFANKQAFKLFQAQEAEKAKKAAEKAAADAAKPAENPAA
jgi:hypothetical protein